MEGKPASLYIRLDGYDAIAAVVDDLLPRCVLTICSVDSGRAHAVLIRLTASGKAVDFIVAAAGGPTIYLGRDMKMSHKGMGITKADYAAFMRCLSDTLNTFEVLEPERSEVVTFATSLEPEIVEA